MATSRLFRAVTARRSALVVGLALLGAGCGNSATIYLPDDQWVSGTITHSDAKYLYVEQDDESTVRVRADKVESIDHPGTFMQIAGGGLLFAGLQMLASTPSANGTDEAVFLGTIAGPGAVIAGWGIWANLRSRGAARAPALEKQRLQELKPYQPAPTYPPPAPVYPPPLYQPAPTYQPAPAYPPAYRFDPAQSDPAQSNPAPTPAP